MWDELAQIGSRRLPFGRPLLLKLEHARHRCRLSRSHQVQADASNHLSDDARFRWLLAHSHHRRRLHGASVPEEFQPTARCRTHLPLAAPLPDRHRHLRIERHRRREPQN